MIENDDLDRAVDELLGIVERRARRGRYHVRHMIHPRIDTLLDNVDSRYALVIVAAKRARQINNYHHQLGEGTFDEFAAAARRVALEELLDDVPGGSRPGQDQVRVPLALSRQVGSAMARVLLGVTGGIAAYKACELTRLLVRAATRSSRSSRPAAERFVAAETFRALARRPPSDEPVPAPRARRPARRRAALGEHAREARARPRRQRPHRGGARAPRTGARRAGDEPAHVGARGDAGERRAAARARRRARRPGRGRHGRGRAGRRADGRAGRDRRAGRGAARRHALARRAPRRSSRPAAPASRSTRCASSATARPAGWAWRSPPRRSAAAPT